MRTERTSPNFGVGRRMNATFLVFSGRGRLSEGSRGMARRMLLAALAIAVMTVSAGAQDAGGMGGTGGGFGGRHQKKEKSTTTETPKPKVDEKAYSAALKTIPNKPSDAWGGMR
jgi:hypothetical protein